MAEDPKMEDDEILTNFICDSKPLGKLELVEIDLSSPSAEVLERAKKGVQKHFVILFKPFGDNTISYYDQHSRMIADVSHLVDDKTTKIICTNQVRKFNFPLEGAIRWQGPVTIFASGDESNKLLLTSPAGHQLFHDQFSFLSFSPLDFFHGKVEARLM